MPFKNKEKINEISIEIEIILLREIPAKGSPIFVFYMLECVTIRAR